MPHRWSAIALRERERKTTFVQIKGTFSSTEMGERGSLALGFVWTLQIIPSVIGMSAKLILNLLWNNGGSSKNRLSGDSRGLLHSSSSVWSCHQKNTTKWSQINKSCLNPCDTGIFSPARIDQRLAGLDQNNSRRSEMKRPPVAENVCCCETLVLLMFTPSCSEIQARYFTLHPSRLSHWTRADFGSTAYEKQCPDHLVSIRELTTGRMRALFSLSWRGKKTTFQASTKTPNNTSVLQNAKFTVTPSGNICRHRPRFGFSTLNCGSWSGTQILSEKPAVVYVSKTRFPGWDDIKG